MTVVAQFPKFTCKGIALPGIDVPRPTIDERQLLELRPATGGGGNVPSQQYPVVFT